MPWAAHSCPDSGVSEAPPRPVTPREVAALKAKPALPMASNIRLDKICEEGAWFCPDCCLYVFKESRPLIQPPQPISCPKCDRIGALMHWEPPIF